MKLKIGFVNPPHADWQSANAVTFMCCQSHYMRNGKYPNRVVWLPPPYKYNKYTSFQQVYDELKDADVIMFSSYVWNYQMCDQIAKLAKQDGKVTILGGPHIGTNDPQLLESRTMYDYICEPTKPGEVFMEDFINTWFEKNKVEYSDISWELRSNKKTDFKIDYDYSIFEDHMEYMTEVANYCHQQGMERFLVLETTRGCPYKCVFCEWGGGIGGKVHKKKIDVVKRDIVALTAAGYNNAMLCDANFGIDEPRDLEIFKFAWDLGFPLSDISTVKTKDIERRKKLIDKWFDIIIGAKKLHSRFDNKWEDISTVSVLPTVSIQSVSEQAMKVAKRVDLSLHDKLELNKYIYEKCMEHGLNVPPVELILGMPGSTIDDFYTEMHLIYNSNVKALRRHDYLFLPDSFLSSPDYQKQYQIETVTVYADVADEDGVDYWDSLYKDNRSYFKTIRSCYSYTAEQLYEMYFMNYSADYIFTHLYDRYKQQIDPPEFSRMCYQIFKKQDGFDHLYKQIEDIFDPNTPPKSIKRLNGVYRKEAIHTFLNKNHDSIVSEISTALDKVDGTDNKAYREV